jgi:hypothetical membrane protein
MTFPRNRLGPILWALCFQYFVAEAICAHSFRGYSLSANFISDLGAVHCLPQLCSPLHWLMNASFVMQGMLILVGSLLVRPMFRRNLGTRTGFLLLPLSGIGLIFVGLFPEDTIDPLHYLAAATHFACGGFGMFLLGVSLLQRKRTAVVGRFSAAAGAITLTASLLLTQKIYLGLGVGGMERVAAYPYTVWLVGMGIGLLLGERPPRAS